MTNSKDLKHVFVAHGDNPIPPTGWGAVELIIWQLSTRIRNRGIQVTVVNKPNYRAILEVLWLSFKGKADVVFCHAEKPIRILSWLARRRKFLLISTSHNPIAPEKLTQSELKALNRCHFADYHFVGRDDIVPLILARNSHAKCVTQINAVELENFKTKPVGNGRAICLGRIQERKRQNDLALILRDSGIVCDFVGPLVEKVVISDELRSNMRGEWDRTNVYEHLCEYSCLVLLSRSERQALVVIEAFAAGIPVVVSRDAAWNLDLSKPYIFLVESDEEVVGAVRKAIALRDQYTQEIRQYAEQIFHYEPLVDQYLHQVDQWLAETVH